MTSRRTSAIAIVSLVLVALAAAAATSGWGAGVRADFEAVRTSGNQRCSTTDAFNGLRLSRAVAERTAQLEEQISYVGPDGEGLFLFATPYGDIWMPQAGDKHSLAVVLAEQEQSIYGKSGGSGVRPGDVVIDAGAHVGLFTRTALEAGASRVITFEVTPTANRALRRNVSNGIAAGQVTVVEAGVWHEEAVLPLVIVENCSICNSVTHDLPASIDVPLTTIDRVVRELGLAHVDFIKLDIENAEASALRGAAETLATYHPRVAVALENAKDRLGYADEIIQILRRASDDYSYSCGVCTNPVRGGQILPEILHFETH